MGEFLTTKPRSRPSEAVDQHQVQYLPMPCLAYTLAMRLVKCKVLVEGFNAYRAANGTVFLES